MTEAWNTSQDEIQKQRQTDGCNLERVIAGIMLWSDSMQLVQVSHASAWPIYLFFRNLSKYAHQAADTQVCHPITFIPWVSAVLDPSNTRIAQRDISFWIAFADFFQTSRTARTTPTSWHIANGNWYMLCGELSWIMTSLRHTEMAWSLNASMVSRGAYIPGSSLTLQIILKSE